MEGINSMKTVSFQILRLFISSTMLAMITVSCLSVAPTIQKTLRPTNNQNPEATISTFPSSAPSYSPTSEMATSTSTRSDFSTPTLRNHKVIAFNGGITKGESHIYVMNPDGTGLTNLTNGPSWDEYPTWSPDGKHIAFVSNRDDEIFQLFMMDADGSNVTSLISRKDLVVTEPSWSPKGNKIAFAGQKPYEPATNDVYVLDLDTFNITNLTHSAGSDLYPTWSPDGTKLAFASNRDDLKNLRFDIYVMNDDGSNVKRLTSFGAYDPSWSPDSTKIAFTCGHLSVICIMNPDGSDMTKLMDIAKYEDGEEPSWSTDSSLIIFTSTRDAHDAIYTIDANGSNPTRLTDKTLYSYHNPVWQP